MRLPNGYGGIRKLSGKRRRPYQVCVTVGWDMINGKARQKQKTLGYYATKAEALTALAEYNINPVDLDKAKTTFKDVWSKFIETQADKSDSKQRSLRGVYHHSERLHNKPLSQITLAELQDVIDNMGSHSYKQQFLSSYRGLYDFAFRHGYVKDNTALLLKNGSRQPKPKVNVFTKEEYLAMPRCYDLMFYTGMRVGEILNVRYEDIDFERDLILVRGTKTDSALRFVPVHEKIHDLVHAVQPGEKLWSYHNCYTKLYKDFVKYAPNHKPHDARKTFATACYLCGVDDVLTKRLMGHRVKDLTHSTYIKNDDAELLRTAISKIDFVTCL